MGEISCYTWTCGSRGTGRSVHSRNGRNLREKNVDRVRNIGVQRRCRLRMEARDSVKCEVMNWFRQVNPNGIHQGEGVALILFLNSPTLTKSFSAIC